MRNLFLAAALLLAACGLAAEQPGIVKAEFVFESAPFQECHASTIVETKGGLVAAWFGGTGEKHPDVGIWLSRAEAGGWSAPREVVNGVQNEKLRYPCWNPVLFQPLTPVLSPSGGARGKAPKAGPLMLFYKVGPSPEKWWGMLMTSENGGKNWSAPVKLPEGILGPIKNKPIQLRNGDLLSGSSSEDHGWRVHFERSTDLGKTWQLIGPINDGKRIGAIQPSILTHADGHLQAIGRTRQNRLFTTESRDNGATWSEMGLLELPNPNAGADAVGLADGGFLLVYNHSAGRATQWDFGRAVLNVAVSKDGTNWDGALVLEKHEKGEYSYPAVIQTGDGLVHTVYTWQRKRIKHVVIDPAKLELRPIVKGEWPK